MWWIAVFFLELIFLFFLSRELTKSLSTLFYHITKSQSKTVHILAFLFLPGVVVHELAHLLVANILFVKTGTIEFVPQITKEGVKLGSVVIAKTDPIRRAFIGASPVFVGLFVLMGMLFYIDSAYVGVDSLTWWMVVIAIYTVFEIGNTMFSSRKDMEGTLELFGVILCIMLLLYVLGVRVDVSSLFGVFSAGTIVFMQKADVFLSLPIVIDLGVWGMVRLTRSY